MLSFWTKTNDWVGWGTASGGTVPGCGLWSSEEHWLWSSGSTDSWSSVEHRLWSGGSTDSWSGGSTSSWWPECPSPVSVAWPSICQRPCTERSLRLAPWRSGFFPCHSLVSCVPFKKVPSLEAGVLAAPANSAPMPPDVPHRAAGASTGPSGAQEESAGVCRNWDRRAMPGPTEQTVGVPVRAGGSMWLHFPERLVQVQPSRAQQYS